MRTASAAELNLLAKYERAHWARLKAYRSGSWVDLTDLNGFNWLEKVSIKDDVDSPTAKLKAKLKKAQFELNLSPFIDASPLNDPSTLIDLAVQVTVEIATTAVDKRPESGDWQEVFRGRIFAVDWASPSVVIDARDQGGDLMDLWIEVQRVYGSATGVRVELVMQDILDDNNAALDTIAANYTWNASTTVTMSDTSEIAVGDFIGYADAPLFEITSIVPNTSATILNPSSRTIPTGSGAGTSVAIPAADRVTLYSVNGTASDPLYRNGGTWDDSPDWLVKTYKQSKQRVLQALQALADQIGWKVRYQWQADLDAFALMIYEPPRENTTPDHEFEESMIARVGKLSMSLADIRNKIKVTYGQADSRTSVTASDTSSITKYGLRAMEIAESSTSQIDSSTEANAMANAAKSDLAEPTAEASFDVPLFWPVEVGDLHRWLANSRHFDTDQDLAVAGFSHEIGSKGQAKTTLDVRGKPSGGRRRWLRMEAMPGVAPEVDLYSDDAASSVAAENAQGAIVITYDDPRTMSPPIMDWVLSRCYVDTSSGFTPGAGNLRGVGRLTRFEIGGLVPGTVYYAKVEIIDSSGNVSTISSEVTATALKTGPYHTNNATQPDTLVRNADFTVYTLGTSNDPDFWTTAYASRIASINGATGGVVLRISDTTAVIGYAQSDRTPVPGDDIFEGGIRFRGSGNDDTVTMAVYFYNSAGSLVQTESVSGSIGTGTSWQRWTTGPFEVVSTAVEFDVKVTLQTSEVGGSYIDLDKAWVFRAPGNLLYGMYHGGSNQSFSAAGGEVTIDIDSSDTEIGWGGDTAGEFTSRVTGWHLIKTETNISLGSGSGTATLSIQQDDGGGYADIVEEDFPIAAGYTSMSVQQVVYVEEGDTIRARFNCDVDCSIRAAYTFMRIQQLSRTE